jgi:hypothetical protein
MVSTNGTRGSNQATPAEVNRNHPGVFGITPRSAAGTAAAHRDLSEAHRVVALDRLAMPVVLEKAEGQAEQRGEEALTRLRAHRPPAGLSTEAILALCRGARPHSHGKPSWPPVPMEQEELVRQVASACGGMQPPQRRLLARSDEPDGSRLDLLGTAPWASTDHRQLSAGRLSRLLLTDRRRSPSFNGQMTKTSG